MKSLLSILALVSMISSLLHSADDTAKKPRASIVVTQPLEEGIINPLQTYVGSLYYDQRSELASEFDGVVETITFQEGEYVKKGELLVKLDTDVLSTEIDAKQASIEALKADLTRQERELERIKAIFERKSISQSNYDQVFYKTKQLQAQLKAAESELKSLEIEYRKMHIRAPYSGIIVARNIDVGEWVSKGSPVATLVNPASIEARVNIPARLIEKAQKNRRFEARIEDHDLQVTVKNIIPLADTSTRTFMVEMGVNATFTLIEGMRIDIRIPLLQEEKALIIPRDAVIRRFGQMVVFASVNNQAVMIPVEVIGYKENMAAIRGQGLQEGMSIVTKGNERIFPNMPLQQKAQ